MASETEAVRSVARQEPDAAVGVAAAGIAVGQSNVGLRGRAFFARSRLKGFIIFHHYLPRNQ